MLQQIRKRKADRERRRRESELESTMHEVFGPWAHDDVERWTYHQLVTMIASGELPPALKAHADSRLRVLEQEIGPAGKSARMARWALWTSGGSLVVALGALWRSW